MRHPAVRASVFLLAVACMGAGGYFVWSLQQKIVAERGAERVFEGQAHEAALLVERLRTAQQSYVAEGQGVDYWISRMAETRDALRRTLTGLAGAATAEDARSSAERAAALLVQHEKLDDRARGYIRNAQRLMASDLIFTESAGTVTEIAQAVDRARTDQRTEAEARIDALEGQQLYVLAGSAAGALLLAILLVPAAGPVRPTDTREALRALLNDGTPAGSAMLRPEISSGPMPAASPSGAARQPPAPVPADRPGRLEEAAAVDLTGTARLCADLARIGDAADLPALLERAATLLDASGLIVWVADHTGTSLQPMLAHGYPTTVVARMGSIDREADNAAAAAYRQGELRIVPAQGTRPGAVVAPITNGTGCIGVLAAETRHSSERDERYQAIAAIVAAQLATCVTAAPTPQGSQPI
jgi:hypothetical protein